MVANSADTDVVLTATEVQQLTSAPAAIDIDGGRYPDFLLSQTYLCDPAHLAGAPEERFLSPDRDLSRSRLGDVHPRPTHYESPA